METSLSLQKFINFSQLKLARAEVAAVAKQLVMRLSAIANYLNEQIWQQKQAYSEERASIEADVKAWMERVGNCNTQEDLEQETKMLEQQLLCLQKYPDLLEKMQDAWNQRRVSIEIEERAQVEAYLQVWLEGLSCCHNDEDLERELDRLEEERSLLQQYPQLGSIALLIFEARRLYIQTQTREWAEEEAQGWIEILSNCDSNKELDGAIAVFEENLSSLQKYPGLIQKVRSAAEQQRASFDTIPKLLTSYECFAPA